MNKTAIKNFAIEARNKLIADITYKAGLMGITGDGIAEALPQSTGDVAFYDIGTKEPYAITGKDLRQRARLAERITQKTADTDYPTAYHAVVEEVAYTWFNRLIAVRFMEVNDYLPSRIRVLSSENRDKLEPDLVTTPFDADLELTEAEREEILDLKNENQVDALFQLLFIKQCNALNPLLPKLFEKTDDYTELLLNVSVTDREGVVYKLVHGVDEDDFNVAEGGQVEIIGWMYQYYNTEPKASVDAAVKHGKKVSKEEIPAKTQLFTPDWIVRYMVENSLGRLWLEGHPNTDLKAGWRYYLDEAEQEPEVESQLEKIREEYKTIKPEDIQIMDPCMGSGHILVRAFDVLMQIYETAGYSQRDAAKSILENNLYGLDIDDRAFQLAYFAVVMKARQYNRRILRGDTVCHVYAIQESNAINRKHLKYLGAGMDEGERQKAQEQLTGLLDTLVDAKEYGSILKVAPCDWELLRKFVAGIDPDMQFSVFSGGLDESREKLEELIDIGQVLARQYDVVVTNPPYLGISSGDGKLNEFVKKHYPDSKADFFAVFIERCGEMTAKNRYQAMITMHAWMFLSSYEKLRIKLLQCDTVNMAHLGPKAFEEIGGEVVQTTSFVMRKSHISQFKGTYCRLIEPTSQQGKEAMFLNGENCYYAEQDNFSKIPGNPIAYWVSNRKINIFADCPQLIKKYETRNGMSTTNNDLFLKLWTEVDSRELGISGFNAKTAAVSGKKWFPYNKGGEYCRWYGNRSYIVNWKDDGKELKDYVSRKYGSYSKEIRSENRYFYESVTWSGVGSGKSSFRYSPEGAIFDSGANGLFAGNLSELFYVLGLLNTKIVDSILQILNPTINTGSGTVGNMPIIISEDKKKLTNNKVQSAVDLSKTDWDSFETSWDFQVHPLIAVISKNRFFFDNINNIDLAECYLCVKGEWEERFAKLKANEEELNRIFIKIYGLQDELTPEVEDKDITVHKIFDTKADIPEDMGKSSYALTRQDVIKSLISYAVGCMFGRYSLDEEGLILAGQAYSEKYVYKVFPLAGTGFAGAPSSFDYTHQCCLRKGDDLTECTFEPDMDNVLPITDEEYFKDDIVGRFCEWVKTVYGADSLESNLDFIADALGGRGQTSREVIRNYFLKDFFKDHCKTYSVTGSGKRPIYWLFDSGKENGFKALIYMHRYDENTIGNLRVDYLHRMQHIYDGEIGHVQDIIDNSTSGREVTAATKRKEKLLKQIKECREYDEKIAHLALDRIPIDLDDGVKVNYRKVQTGSDGIFYEVLADSKAIMAKVK